MADGHVEFRKAVALGNEIGQESAQIRSRMFQR